MKNRREEEEVKAEATQEKPEASETEITAQKEEKAKQEAKPKEEAPAVEEKKVEDKRTHAEKDDADNMIPTVIRKLSGPTVVGRIELPQERKDQKKKPVASSKENGRQDGKKKRKRIRKDAGTEEKDRPMGSKKERPVTGKRKKKLHRPEVNEEDVQKQIKDTLAKLTSKGKSKGSKYRREKRDTIHQRQKEEMERLEESKHTIKVTEFVSVSELANMMNVPANEVIQTCMNLGLFVSINQRLDAETLSLVADEFNYQS